MIKMLFQHISNAKQIKTVKMIQLYTALFINLRYEIKRNYLP